MKLYWICTEPIKKGGTKVMGPFVVKDYAFEMRGKLELLNTPVTYWIDDENFSNPTESEQ